MDENKKNSQLMSPNEAIDKLTELKQKVIDENYQEIINEGVAKVDFNFEYLEALEVVLNHINTLEKELDQSEE